MDIFPDTDNPLKIKLPVFEGPLDLLLHLIRKKQVDIHEVRLAELTSSYLEHLEWMREINLDIAAEFLEIAATLIWIKGNALLPKPETDDEESEENPEEELRRRLIEYQQYKEKAYELGTRDLLARDVFGPHIFEEEEEVLVDAQEPVFEDLSLLTLMDAFQKLMERRPKVITHHVVETETYRIEDRIEELIDLLLQQTEWAFENFFDAEHTRAQLVISFMALLEMMKLKLLCVTQESLFAPIVCQQHPDFHENLKLWKQTA